MPVEIDDDLCGLCLGCAIICPERFYTVEKDHLVISEGCTDCLLCVECCPIKAISQID